MTMLTTKPQLLPLPQETEDRVAELLADPEKIAELESKFPKAETKTEHFLHGGMYVRTMFTPAGTAVICAKIDPESILILQGTVDFVRSPTEVVRFEGYNVLKGASGRRQLAIAVTDLYSTLVFPTTAKTVEEAEEEMTPEFEALLTRRDHERGSHRHCDRRCGSDVDRGISLLDQQDHQGHHQGGQYAEGVE